MVVPLAERCSDHLPSLTPEVREEINNRTAEILNPPYNDRNLYSTSLHLAVIDLLKEIARYQPQPVPPEFLERLNTTKLHQLITARSAIKLAAEALRKFCNYRS